MQRLIIISCLVTAVSGQLEAQPVVIPTLVTGRADAFSFEFELLLSNSTETDASCSLASFEDSGEERSVQLSILNVSEPAMGIPVLAGDSQLAVVLPPAGEESFAGWAVVDCGGVEVEVGGQLRLADSVDQPLQSLSDATRSVVPVGGHVASKEARWMGRSSFLGQQITRSSAFAVVNPGETAVTVEIGFTEAGAQQGVSTSIELAPKQRLARFLSEILPNAFQPITGLPPQLEVRLFGLVAFEATGPVAVGGLDVLWPDVKYAPGFKLRD